VRSEFPFVRAYTVVLFGKHIITFSHGYAIRTGATPVSRQRTGFASHTASTISLYTSAPEMAIPVSVRADGERL
jgi:hypothetical protein